MALPDEVLQAARAGDEHVEPGGQGLHLGVLPDPAEDHGCAQPGRAGQGLDDGQNLVGQLPSWHEDQGAGLTAPAGAAGQAGDDGDGEGQGLATPGLPPTEDIPPGEGVA